MWMIEKFFTTAFSFIFPSSCFLCKKNDSVICEECLHTLPEPIDTPAPFIVSLYSFKDPRIKKIIHAAKYFHRKDILHFLGDQISTKLESNSKTFDLIIPIPMLTLRKYIRGYNQSNILAKRVSEKLSIPYSLDTLTKQKATLRQVEIKKRSLRLLNQKNSFSVTRNLSGLNILLIDDVATTGATFSEAREKLIKHGAAKVSAISIAH
jgi:competence protein ComFC